MSAEATLQHLLRRDRALSAAFLTALALLAWGYLWSTAGAGPITLAVALLPHGMTGAPVGEMAGMSGMAAMDAMPVAAVWTLRTWLLAIAMWWTMMVAMMIPAAAPTILLYANVRQGAAQRGAAAGLVSTATFAGAYLLVWLAFAIVATLLQWALVQRGLISLTILASASRWLSVAVLLAAGLYQFSPLKVRCLMACRSPAAFLSQHWRGGRFAALRLGARHGVYCVGCCSVLMTLLFVGGVMNLAWIALLTLLVVAEKLLPAGLLVGRVSGAVLCLWGLAVAVL